MKWPAGGGLILDTGYKWGVDDSSPLLHITHSFQQQGAVVVKGLALGAPPLAF